jgi:hypothetical protein
MKQKYISQIDSYNFLYPNNTMAEYDVNIVHDLKENDLTGTVTDLTLTSNAGNIDVVADYTWNLNDTEPFINNYDELNLINVYFQTPEKPYFNLWVNVYVLKSTNRALTSTGGTMSFTITPAMMNEAEFRTSGNYSITFQFISRRTTKVFPFLYQLSPVPVSPTPTPSHTITPTPTPTSGLTTTPTPTPTITPTNSPTASSLTMTFQFSPDPGYTGYCELYYSSDGVNYYVINTLTTTGSITLNPTPGGWYYMVTTKTGGSGGSGTKYSQSEWNIDGIANINVGSGPNPQTSDTVPFQVAYSGSHTYGFHGYITNLL